MSIELDPIQEQALEAFRIELTTAQSVQAQKVAQAVRRVLAATAESSLFDTEPSNLDATLAALADRETFTP